MKPTNRRKFLKTVGTAVTGTVVASMATPQLTADENTATNTNTVKKLKYRQVDFTKIVGVPCPCGTSRRGLIDEPNFPGTIHRTDIDQTAKAHYHKKLTEIYYVISCEPGAVMVLDGKEIPLKADMAFYIPPETVHQLVGKAKTFITVLPKFDPTDEYFPNE
ncbi:MAG: cupin domain-containing protein [Planctomycetaceae bacterium]|nr:cupin domain-containing protein [Planctomycetaceae bacterium]